METSIALRCARPARPIYGASHRWRVLGVGVAANMSFSAAAAGIPTTAIWLRADYHLGNAALGLVLGALGLGVALSELPWGIAADRLGDRRVLLAGLAATTAALVAMTLGVVPSAHRTPPLALVAAAMTLVGLLGGSVNGSSGRAVMRWFAEGERGLAMSIRQTAVPLGGGFGAAVLPALASHVGFAGVYGTLALLCTVSAWLTWRWLHEPPESSEPYASGAVPGSDVRESSVSGAANLRVASSAAPAGTRSPLRSRAIWRVVLGIGALCTPQFAVLTFATVFLHDALHVGLAGITAAMVTIQIGAMISRVLSGRYTDKYGNRRGYVRGMVWVCVAAFGTLAVAASAGGRMPVGAIVALLVFAGICVSAWHGVAYTELATLAGAQQAGTALGMANTAVYAGLFITPLAIPHLLAVGSWEVVWAAAAVCAAFTLWLFPR